MSTFNSAYIGYHLNDDETAGFRIKTFKNINSRNSYTVGYVHHVSRTFNFLLGRLVYFSQLYNKPVSEVIITGKDLAKNINCHKSHAAYVLNSLKEIFNLEFDRHGNFHGARTIRINKNIIDFLKVYSEEDLQAYIEYYNLHEHAYTVRRLYERKIWEVPDSQLSRKQQKEKVEFMKDPDIHNYHHETYTKHKGDNVRIKLVETNYNKLSSVEKAQIDRIKTEKRTGKLSYYLHKVLIKLEQKISFIIDQLKRTSNVQESTQSQVTNRNTEGTETTAHKAATRAAVKNPEDPEPALVMSYQEIMQFFMLWNSMTHLEKMDQIKVITPDRIQSINNLVKSYGKENLFKALKRIRNLYHDVDKYQYKMNFNRFIQDETFISVLETTSKDSRLDQHDWETGIANIMLDNDVINSVPEFESKSAAIAWWNENN